MTIVRFCFGADSSMLSSAAFITRGLDDNF
jgi:hypothetical protein